MLILGQKACFLGPTIFEMPQPNWYYYGYLSHFFWNKHFFITHVRDLHYKGLDIESSIPLITRGFSSHSMMKELRLPLDFSWTLFKIMNLYYFISNIFHFKKLFGLFSPFFIIFHLFCNTVSNLFFFERCHGLDFFQCFFHEVY